MTYSDPSGFLGHFRSDKPYIVFRYEIPANGIEARAVTLSDLSNGMLNRFMYVVAEDKDNIPRAPHLGGQSQLEMRHHKDYIPDDSRISMFVEEGTAPSGLEGYLVQGDIKSFTDSWNRMKRSSNIMETEGYIRMTPHGTPSLVFAPYSSGGMDEVVNSWLDNVERFAGTGTVPLSFNKESLDVYNALVASTTVDTDDGKINLDLAIPLQDQRTYGVDMTSIISRIRTEIGDKVVVPGFEGEVDPVMAGVRKTGINISR